MCFAMDALNDPRNDGLSPAAAIEAHYDRTESTMADPEAGASARPQTLEEMQDEVRHTNMMHGWYEESRTFGEDMVLLHSEVSEAFEAFRDHGLTDATGARHGHPGFAGPCPTDNCPLPKPEGVGSELADVLIRLLDTCERTGIDLRAEYARKMAYNQTRPYKHGGKRL